MATYDAHVADAGTTIGPKTLRVAGVAVGSLVGATFVVRVTNPSGVVESWTAGFTGGAAGALTFVTPTNAYWDEVGTWTWDVQYTLGGVVATCDPITLSVGPSGSAPGAGSPPDPTWINVRGYGAVADGTTDDEPAIQDALDAAAALSTGAVVYIPPGVYYIGNSLIVGSRTHVLGAGRGLTILRSKAGAFAGKTVNSASILATLAAVAADSVTIEALTVDHQTNDTTANGIVLVPDGVNAQGTPCTDSAILDCEVQGHPAAQYLIWMLRAQRCRVVGCYVDGYDLAGAALGTEGIEQFGGYDNLIQGNTLRRIAGNAINCGAAAGVDNTETVRLSVLGNTISECDKGIALGTANGAPEGPQNLSQVLVANNVIEGARAYGIGVATGTAGTTITDLCIRDNVIADSAIGIHAILIAADTGHRGFRIQGNHISGATDADEAALCLYTANHCEVVDNHISGSAYAGILIHTCLDVGVHGNTIEDCQAYAVNINASDRVRLEGNTMIEWGLGFGVLGVIITDCTDVFVKRNTMRATLDGTKIQCDGASDRVRIADNESLSGTLTWSNLGTNPNYGTAAAGAGVALLDVTNSLAHAASRFHVEQTAGVPLAFGVAFIAGGFRISFTGAVTVGNETFRWEIVQ